MRMHQFVFGGVAVSLIGLAWISPQPNRPSPTAAATAMTDRRSPPGHRAQLGPSGLRELARWPGRWTRARLFHVKQINHPFIRMNGWAICFT